MNTGLPLGDGFTRLTGDRVHVGGAAAALCRWLDGMFLRMALESGAVEWRVPATIARAALERAGFFEAFPMGETPIGSDTGDERYCLCPAVCYHAYASFAEQRLDGPIALTAVQTCFRPGDRLSSSPARLWEFTMREVVFLGPCEWVEAETDRWVDDVARFARSVGLEGAVEQASDPFFGPMERGKRLLQQVKGLKREFRLDCGEEHVAVASFNRHETFFSNRFGFGMRDRGVAHTGCVAFGIERWALAFLSRHGLDAARTLVTV